MIVDDDQDDIFFLRRIVEKAVTCAVATYDGPEAAIEYLIAAAKGIKPMPAALLSDIKMPGMNGFEFLQQVRARPELAGLRIAMVSGSDLPADRERARQLGADSYFVKFPEPTELAKFLRPA